MPNFNRDRIAKGGAAIREANESRGQGGNFRPFLPQIYWKDDGDERFLLFLNTLDEIVRVDLHPFVETEDGNRMVMARTDDCIGEPSDPLSDQWQYLARKTNIMIAVELEPTFENRNGRQRVTGFQVGTKTIERRVRDDEGKLTDETEEFEIPLVGFVAQSPSNFGNQLESYDNTENPIELTPFKVKQAGRGSGLSYQFIGYPDVDVDLTNLLEYIENVSYVADPADLLALIGDQEGIDAGLTIGQYLLDLKLEELADPNFYSEVLNATNKPYRYAKEKNAKATPRSKRPSQRRPRDEEDTTPVARSREPEETTSKPTTAKERLEALKAKKAAADAKKATAA